MSDAAPVSPPVPTVPTPAAAEPTNAGTPAAPAEAVTAANGEARAAAGPAHVEAPPPFEPSNAIELVSVTDGKIVHVSLYSGRAEITRSYKFAVRTGQNQVNISGLPNVMDKDSLRVEGKGAATIHDVTLSTIPPPPVQTTSPALVELLKKKERTERALERCKKSIKSLETFLNTLDVQHIGATDISGVMDNYNETGERLDDRALELEEALKETEREIESERERLAGPRDNAELQQRAAISVFAQGAGEVEIVLIYAVSRATWAAGYDIRVDMQAKEKPITLIYKAAITQSTGEDWTDVPLTLETASPTFGLEIPSLTPWTLSVYKPFAYARKAKSKGLSMGGGSFRRASVVPAPSAGAAQYEYMVAEHDEDEGASAMDHRGLAVSSKGSVSATFQVPGAITVPSDGASHNVTVTELTLDATMSWVTVPKKDTKTHLKAKIKNASDYTLLQGTASVYVDGSFISKSDVPLVSPQESFDCPLGLDPTIRVTYHPRIKKVSQSGFYMSKTSNHVFTQRITIFNTKSSSIENLKVVDQFPISEDSQITVKFVSPPLNIPNPPDTVTGRDGTPKLPAPVKVADGVVAQWEGADESGFDLETLGKDGKIYWACAVPAQGKVNLTLTWEVTAPLRTDIVGLTF